MTFKTYSYITLAQGLDFVSDMKVRPAWIGFISGKELRKFSLDRGALSPAWSLHGKALCVMSEKLGPS